MGLYVPAMWKAVNTRLTGDSTLVALLAGGSANSITCYQPTPVAVDSSSAQYPWVYYKLGERRPDDAFATRRHEFEFEVHVMVQERPPSAVTADPITTLAKIEERIIGDWSEQSTRVPSYGLDRYIPDVSAQTGDAATNYSPEMIVYNGTIDLSEPGILHWSCSFLWSIDKAVP